MGTVLNNLKPEKIWYYFEEICMIPRPSKKEFKIAEYLKEFGKQNHLETIQDAIGNILIRKPASKGKENIKSVVLQSHMDMVCEKNSDKEHNFELDSIEPFIDGEWVKAKGTTLGADDGIGMAAQLAILADSTIELGPIECLFTVDEETGLTGAFGLQHNLLKSTILLNLDSEDEGELFIGCAGGKDTTITFNYKKDYVPRESVAYKISVSGLKGGHSGDDIEKGLGNSLKIINRLLWFASTNLELRIEKLDGGNLRNAIPREAFAVVVIPEKFKNSFEEYVIKYELTIKKELQTTEPNLKISFDNAELPRDVMDKTLQEKLIQSLYACPHGVIAMSQDMPGLVETSTNLASIKTSDETIIITTSQRSSVESAKENIANMVAATFKLAGAETKHGDGYPGWKPNLDSEILKLSSTLYTKLFNKKPKVRAIHAGLECGVIGEKYSGMDMISFGPTLRGVHSPAERINIATVDAFWKHLVEILKNIPSV